MTRHVRLMAPDRAPPYLLAGPEPSGAVCVQCEQAHGVVYRIRRWHWGHAVPLHTSCAAAWFNPRPGVRLATTIERLARRDALLVAAAARFYPSLSMNEQAHRLARELGHYRAGAWRRERALDCVPPRHVGRLHELLWQALRAHDRTLAARSIRFVLSVAYLLPTDPGKGELPPTSGE